jgi:hypothetical protein
VWSGEREIGNQIQRGRDYVERGFVHTATTGSAAGPKVRRKKIALFFFFLVLSFVLRSIRGDTLGHGHWAPLIRNRTELVRRSGKEETAKEGASITDEAD